MAQLKLEHINKYYDSVHAVKDLSFHCNDKEFLAILGPSGCGKSSTLRMLAGLEEATSGAIIIGERNVTKLSPSERNIGLAFEDYALYPHLSVYENIVFPFRVRGYSDEQIKQVKILKELVELLELNEILNSFPKKLSGGQAQLVSLVRCLVKDVDLYLLDEPLSHLDEEMRVKMRTMLKIMHNKMQKTFVYVTHDQLEAFSLADRIAIINYGVLQQIGSPEEIYENPRNLFVAGFIGEPPMNFVKVLAKVIDGQLMLTSPSFVIPIPKKFLEKVKANEEYILGVRPESISLSYTFNETAPIKTVVTIFENLGELNQITMELDGKQIITETEPYFKVEMGAEVFLGFDYQKIHLFDCMSSNSLTY